MLRIPASVAVLFCHVSFPAPVDDYTVAVCRYAVPFFYLVTGWFLWREDEVRGRRAMLRSLRTTLRMLFMATVISLPATMIGNLIKGKPFQVWLDYYRTPETLHEFLLYNRSTFISSITWYLFALLYAQVIYLVLVRIRLRPLLCALSPVLLAAGVYRVSVLHLPWYYTGNWLYTALPLLVLGTVLRERGWCQKLPAWSAWVMVVLGTGLTLWETSWNGQRFLTVGVLMLAFGMFTLAIQGWGLQWKSWLTRFGREATPVIFLVHCPLREMIYAWTGKPEGVLGWQMPFVILDLSVVIALVVMLVRAVTRELKRVQML